jgi:hypothetical protein
MLVFEKMEFLKTVENDPKQTQIYTQLICGL